MAKNCTLGAFYCRPLMQNLIEIFFLYFGDEARCFRHARRHIHLQRRTVLLPDCGSIDPPGGSSLRGAPGFCMFSIKFSRLWAKFRNLDLMSQMNAILSPGYASVSQLTSFLQLSLLTFCIFFIPSIRFMYRVLEDLGVEKIIILKGILNK